MLVEEMPRSFVKKNNSYSHCPLKKRPVHVLLTEEVPEVIKGESRIYWRVSVPLIPLLCANRLLSKSSTLSFPLSLFRSSSRTEKSSPLK